MSYPIAYLSHIANQSWNALPSSVTFFLTQSMIRISIFLEEVFAIIASVCPAAFKWVVRKYVWNEIQTFEIKGTKKAVAYLYCHGLIPSIGKKEKIDSIAHKNLNKSIHT